MLRTLCQDDAVVTCKRDSSKLSLTSIKLFQFRQASNAQCTNSLKSSVKRCLVYLQAHNDPVADIEQGYIRAYAVDYAADFVFLIVAMGTDLTVTEKVLPSHSTAFIIEEVWLWVWLWVRILASYGPLYQLDEI